MSEAPYGAYNNRDVSFCPLSLPPTRAPHACFLMYEVGGESTAADDTDDGEERSVRTRRGEAEMTLAVGTPLCAALRVFACTIVCASLCAPLHPFFFLLLCTSV